MNSTKAPQGCVPYLFVFIYSPLSFILAAAQAALLVRLTGFVCISAGGRNKGCAVEDAGARQSPGLSELIVQILPVKLRQQPPPAGGGCCREPSNDHGFGDEDKETGSKPSPIKIQIRYKLKDNR